MLFLLIIKWVEKCRIWKSMTLGSSESSLKFFLHSNNVTNRLLLHYCHWQHGLMVWFWTVSQICDKDKKWMRLTFYLPPFWWTAHFNFCILITRHSWDLVFIHILLYLEFKGQQHKLCVYLFMKRNKWTDCHLLFNAKQMLVLSYSGHHKILAVSS